MISMTTRWRGNRTRSRARRPRTRRVPRCGAPTHRSPPLPSPPDHGRRRRRSPSRPQGPVHRAPRHHVPSGIARLRVPAGPADPEPPRRRLTRQHRRRVPPLQLGRACPPLLTVFEHLERLRADTLIGSDRDGRLGRVEMPSFWRRGAQRPLPRLHRAARLTSAPPTQRRLGVDNRCEDQNQAPHRHPRRRKPARDRVHAMSPVTGTPTTISRRVIIGCGTTRRLNYARPCSAPGHTCRHALVIPVQNDAPERRADHGSART
jgi:hypothetical protein